MRRFALGFVAGAACMSAFAVSGSARADSMDPALERLVHDAKNPAAPCANFGQYRPGAAPCVFDDASFKRIINQYGFAFAPLVYMKLATLSEVSLTLGLSLPGS